MGIDLIALNDDDNLTVNLENIADYSQGSSGIIANLVSSKVITPIYGTVEQPKILTIGDSITAGEHPVEPTPGAYRLQLQNNYIDDDLDIDFVGSQINEGVDLNDAEHEGHPGWTINELTEFLDTEDILTSYQPNIVLLMAGTNDILRFDDASTVIADLNQLIEHIRDELTNTWIFVSSITPLDPTDKGQQRANIVEEVNALLPDIAEQKGERVTYVNAGGSLELDDLATDDIHPNTAGYQEIGNAWYDALLEKDTLTGVDHIIGTAYNDRLTGNEQANVLFGNGGIDILSGGEGADSFVYQSPDLRTDTITDFSSDDRFLFSASGFNVDFIPNITLTEINSTTGVFFSSMTNCCSIWTSPNFFYETKTGILSFDRDGFGASMAIDIAILSNIPTLSSEQFMIVA